MVPQKTGLQRSSLLWQKRRVSKRFENRIIVLVGRVAFAGVE
jgi:hypothetical protein